MSTDNTKNVFASMITAVITKTSTAPLSRIKILQQIQGYHNETQYSKFYNGLRKIYKADGIKGFYKGNLANVIKAVPTYAIKLPLNDFYIKHIYKMEFLIYYYDDMRPIIPKYFLVFQIYNLICCNDKF